MPDDAGLTDAPLTDAVVLAGGFGTRLRAAVSDVPKPLAPVAGRPFLAWLLDQLAKGGLRHIVLATGYLGDMVESAIGPRHAGMAISYAREEQPLGTGGAVRDALPLAHGAQVLVLNGDTFLRVNYAAMHRATRGADIGMAVLPVADRARYGAVVIQNGMVTGFTEKQDQPASAPVNAGHINGGVYLLRRDLPGLRQAGMFSLERDVLQRDVTSLRIAAHEVPGPFIDIGTPEDYARAQYLLPEWSAAP